MEYEIENIKFMSYSKLCDIHAKIFVPKNIKIKGIVQIVHGMTEYIDKYIETIEYLLEKGYIVCGHDHLGHGDSYAKKEDRGYFGEKDGYKALIKDTYTLTKFVKNKYPKYNYFMLGHSMGSFIAIIVLSMHNDAFDGVIFMGTGGPNSLASTGIKVARRMAEKKGARYVSTSLIDAANRFFNAGIKNPKTSHDWTTRDEEVIAKRLKDKRADFSFSVKGYEDLFSLSKLANDEKTLAKIDNKKHIIFLSGDKDPVGNNGKGVAKLYEYFLENNYDNVEIKLYKDARHELLKELNKETVKKDIVKFLEKVAEDLEKEEKTKLRLEEYIFPQLVHEYNLNTRKKFAILIKVNRINDEHLYGEDDIEIVNIINTKKDNILETPVYLSLIDGCNKFDNNLERMILISNDKLSPMEIAACNNCNLHVVYYLKGKYTDKQIDTIKYLAKEKGTYAFKEIKFVD